MNRLIYKGFIEDVRNEKCTDQEIEKLKKGEEYGNIFIGCDRRWISSMGI